MRLLALVCLLAGPLLAQDSTRDWINRGVQEFKAGHYPEASAAFQKAVDSDPASATARLYLATSWMQRFIPGADSAENLAFADAANREFLKVLDIDPANRTAMGSLASLSLNQKNWDQAEEWYRKLIAARPRQRAGLVQHGIHRVVALVSGVWRRASKSGDEPSRPRPAASRGRQGRSQDEVRPSD